MDSVKLPEDCSKQWEVLLLLLSSEEKKIDRTCDSEVEVMNYFYNNEGVRQVTQFRTLYIFNHVVLVTKYNLHPSSSYYVRCSSQFSSSSSTYRKILEQWLLEMHSAYAKQTTNVDTATKSDEVSLHWRQKGNECFRTNAIDDSYSCYTKSVLYAVPSGEMYPLALANRSAALLRLKRYEVITFVSYCVISN